MTEGPHGPSLDKGPEQDVSAAPLPHVNRHRTREETMCFNCGCAEHFRAKCMETPRCPSTLALLGYGTGEGGFYFIDAILDVPSPRPQLLTGSLV
ncbi:hypothetical protein D1007_38499 [Hordeum vulgare]|nr:hypothetical protein D1007_38499 [Hordeum vulgare]